MQKAQKNNLFFCNLLILLAVLSFLAIPFAYGETVRVDITQGKVEPLPIAIPAFIGTDDESTKLAENVSQVIINDLVSTGLFRLIDPNAYIQKLNDVNLLPRFGDWRIINAQALVQANLRITNGNKITLQSRLWDVFAEKQLLGQSFSTDKENWRRIAHILADKIYERMTGERGYFDTRIVYIAESGPKDKRIKRLAVMDQDGYNHQFLTNGSSLVLTPRFSPTLQQITYLSYVTGKPHVYIFDIETGRHQVVGSFKNMTYAPRFSPDGDKIIMSHEEHGNSEIYEMNLRNNKVRRVTKNPAIDTSPSYSPDGNRIVFNSDRGGSPQLYVMDADGGNVQRISFGRGYYSTPVWSPRGDWIAFTKQTGGQFHIGVIKPDGSGERLITRSYLDEGPTWSPNGRVLMFFRQAEPGGDVALYSIDLTGYNLRRIITPGEASDPACCV